MISKLAQYLPFFKRPAPVRIGGLEVPQGVMALIPFAASRRSNRAALIATVATGVATLMGVAGRAWYGRRQRHHRAVEPASETDQPDTRPYPLRTRDELYAMAQERDIAGRSQMTKAELVEALRQTEAA